MSGDRTFERKRNPFVVTTVTTRRHVSLLENL